MPVGSRRSLRLLGAYSDGSEALLPEDARVAAHWITRVAGPLIVSDSGVATGVEPGRCEIEARVDSFSARCAVEVVLPLAERLHFPPAWDSLRVRSGNSVVFSARPVDGPEPLRFHWRRNAMRLPENGADLAFTVSEDVGPGWADTIAVAVRRGMAGAVETAQRRWVIAGNRLPAIAGVADSVLSSGHFRTTVMADDADGDRLLFLLTQAPAGMMLDPRTGELTWPGVPDDVEEVALTVRVLDGIDAASQRITLRALAAKIASLSTLGAYPNPFNATVAIHTSLPAGAPATATAAIYDVLGRRVAQLPPVDRAGRLCFLWNGRSDAGRQLASGIYLYVVRTARGSRTGKVVLVR